MARTILRDSHRLAKIADELKQLAAAIDNEENVPERYSSSLAGELADADCDKVIAALEVVQRLDRWSRFESHITERYTRLLPEVVA